MKYYINGWEETKSYFFSFGFTEEEKKKLFNGEQVKKDNNIFWIEK